MLQIVDIALKAISPAVNDPTTAIGCVDQLTRILIRFASRDMPEPRLYDLRGIARVSIQWIDFERLLDSAFEQIRMYSKGDIAVSLRLLRAFGRHRDHNARCGSAKVALRARAASRGRLFGADRGGRAEAVGHPPDRRSKSPPRDRSLLQRASLRLAVSLIDAQKLTSRVLYVVQQFTRPLQQIVNFSAPLEASCPPRGRTPLARRRKGTTDANSEK